MFLDMSKKIVVHRSTNKFLYKRNTFVVASQYHRSVAVVDRNSILVIRDRSHWTPHRRQAKTTPRCQDDATTMARRPSSIQQDTGKTSTRTKFTSCSKTLFTSCLYHVTTWIMVSILIASHKSQKLRTGVLPHRSEAVLQSQYPLPYSLYAVTNHNDIVTVPKSFAAMPWQCRGNAV